MLSFVRYIEDVENVISTIQLTDKRMVLVTNMYNVTQQFDVHVPDEEMALYKSLFPQFRHLKVSNVLRYRVYSN